MLDHNNEPDRQDAIPDTQDDNEDSPEMAELEFPELRKQVYPNNLHLLIISLLVIFAAVSWQARVATPCKDNINITDDSSLKYVVYSNNMRAVEDANGLLKHVHLVLNRMGFLMGNNQSDWSLLWSHDFPFRQLFGTMLRLKPHQRVNHFPGIGHISLKVQLSSTDSEYIPKAFKLPLEKKEFLSYAKEHKDAVFLQKNNDHRGVYLKNVTEIDLDDGNHFIQEYIQKPFLVDGHKFDIGVYVVLTSVDPLRLYWYKGDVLFRYCPAKYYPFDPTVEDKYVIGDDYLPTWEVPSLAHLYTALGYSMKDAFDAYVRTQGKDPEKMWERVQKAITEIFVLKEHYIIEALKSYPSKHNFFELLRVDLIVDEDLNVYLLEANMSPNLSSAHFPPNRLLYEQVLYSVFSLAGLRSPRKESFKDLREQEAIDAMMSSNKNIAVYGIECSTICKESCEAAQVCKTCKPCLSAKMRRELLAANTEFLHRADFRRLFPPPMVPNVTPEEMEIHSMTESNLIQHLWMQGKCNIDVTWCS